MSQQTIAMETFVRRSANYLTRMVDADNLPYFNIFHTQPAEAAHDWPDFGDVMSRQWQAAIMARRMTGEALPVERAWQEKVLSYLDPDSGLLRRPATTYSQPIADAGDQALTRVGSGATQHGVDPGDQFLVVEGLGQVVVATALEGLDALDRVGVGAAEHDHRYLAVPSTTRLAFAQAPADLRRGGIGQLVPDQDEIGQGLLCQSKCLGSGARLDYREARHRELALE